MLKKKRFLPVLVLAAVMLVAVAVAIWNQSGDLLEQVRFYDSIRGQALDVHYDIASDSYVLFLPEYLSPENIQASCPDGMAVRFDGQETLESATAQMTVTAPLRMQTVNLRLESVGALPAVFIEAEDGILDYLHQDKDNARDVAVRMMDEEGNLLLQSTASMYGRGNGSWDSPSKRPYNLEFAHEISVGPFENVTRLALLAEHSDESKLRNGLAYYAGRELGIDYASPYQYANVYVNGEYLGLYGTVTKQVYESHLESDGIQAVLEIASSHNAVEFDSSLGWRINVMYGSKSRVQSLVEALETALVQEDWSAVGDLIDLESFARKYALEEYLANLDLCYASQYFYVGNDGKLRCMLPWDYDWSLGSSYLYYNNRQENELKVRRSDVSWYALLLKNEAFRLTVAQVLETQFDDIFLKTLEDHLARQAEAIGPAWGADRLRWAQELPYDIYDVASGMTDLEEFCQAFGAYFYERRAFLVDYFRNPESYATVSLVGARWGNLVLPRGTNLAEYLDGATVLDVNTPGERFLGWFGLDGEPADTDLILDEDIMFVGYYEELEADTQSKLEMILTQHGWKLVLCLLFGSLALVLFWENWKRMRQTARA